MSETEGTSANEAEIKVLYIEDNGSNVKLMQDIFLEFLPYTLVSASTAEEGIVLSKQLKPDLILMDINLHGISGHEALKIIKADSDISSIPVIAISADVIPNQPDEISENGFDDYISKPFDLADLIKRLKQRLG
ncbi:MAG: response regulator [Gammaproteobacteria bacterium]|nr:response regulator [Gammaproteobacteria bacterium]